MKEWSYKMLVTYMSECGSDVSDEHLLFCERHYYKDLAADLGNTMRVETKALNYRRHDIRNIRRYANVEAGHKFTTEVEATFMSPEVQFKGAIHTIVGALYDMKKHGYLKRRRLSGQWRYYWSGKPLTSRKKCPIPRKSNHPSKPSPKVRSGSRRGKVSR